MVLCLIFRYQQLLHRNLVYLATLADSTQSMQNTIPVREGFVILLFYTCVNAIALFTRFSFSHLYYSVFEH